MKKVVVCFIATYFAVVTPYHHMDHQYHPPQEHTYMSDKHKNYAYPKYVYEYGVNDPHTHDAKKQWESRDGDIVKGSYKLVQPDGRIRIVNYYADDKNGFNAEVKYQGKANHPGKYHRPMADHKTQGSAIGSSTLGSHVSQGHLSSSWIKQLQQCPKHHTSSHQVNRAPAGGHSAVRMGYSVGLAGGLDPHVVGFDTQEPHGYEVQEIINY